MAVFTELSSEDIAALLERYTLGTLTNAHGIAEGVENTNYLITVMLDGMEKRYILTIYEKRVKREDLPFFTGLLRHLAGRGIACPLPIEDRHGTVIQALKGKPAVVSSFLEGASSDAIQGEHVKALGTALAELHLAGEGYGTVRENNLSPTRLRPLLEQIGPSINDIEPSLCDALSDDITVLEDLDTSQLPCGVIHADLFPDNVFFDAQGRISGIIDFYFACTDALIVDLAICMNAWCFDASHRFDAARARCLLQHYHHVRPITQDEWDILPLIARGAAMRFLLTRAQDWLIPSSHALITPKNPDEYIAKWRFHRHINHYRHYEL